MSLLLAELRGSQWGGQLSDNICFPGSCRNCPVLMAQQTQKMQLMLEEVARLRAEISSVKQVLRRVGEGGLAGQKPLGLWVCGTADCSQPAFAPGASWAAQALLRPHFHRPLQAAQDSLGTPAPLAALAGLLRQGWDPGTLTGGQPSLAGLESTFHLPWRVWRMGTRVWGPSSTHLGAVAMAVDTDTVPQSCSSVERVCLAFLTVALCRSGR